MMSRAELFLSGAIAAACVLAPDARAQDINLSFFTDSVSRPVYVTSPPGDLDRVFIVEQRLVASPSGRIRVFNRSTGNFISEYLTVPGVGTFGEQGLVGMAFHPDYLNNGTFFIYYTDTDGDTFVERVQVSANPNVADETSRDVILTVEQPGPGHNAGWISFGPDGYLYIALGDGSCCGDDDAGHNPEIGNSQDLDTLLGKMLRIDVDGDDFPKDDLRDYAIPPSNPFVGVEGRDEIWAYGLRNPWRNAFDRVTGDLYIADVGQNTREEVSFQPASSTGGENYGWRCFEGNIAFNSDNCGPSSGMVFPFYEHFHGGTPNRCAIIGGEVYRGCALEGFDGKYFFSDYCADQLWSFRYDGVNLTDFVDHTADVENPGLTLNLISGFGTDGYGEIYVCSLSGDVYRISPETGFVDMNENQIPDACEHICPGDLTTTGANPGDGFHGVPDSSVNLTDLLFYVSTWDADLGSPSPNPGSIADVTTTGTAEGEARYGIPDGDVNLSDLIYYVNQWGTGITLCP